MPDPTPAPAGQPAARPRRGIFMWFLRLLFSGKRALLTVPIVLCGGYIAWQSLVYLWYRGASVGEKTGVITKVSRKGSPLCRYDSVEMRVGQQAGTAVLGAETWEFTVDPAYEWLMPQLQEAERKQQPITVQYRQDTTDVQAGLKAPPHNLPWRYCVSSSYHATGVIAGSAGK